ncbi:hypothetical protein BHE74_00023357 [Ensete ventricosum]|nr:hypothetical protein BHE74_00023357 [Ensete ventricosum]
MAEGGAGKSGEAPATVEATMTIKKAPRAEVEELPKAIVRRVVKDKLSQLASVGEEEDVSVQKDALLAFSESTRIFIHYVSAT